MELKEIKKLVLYLIEVYFIYIKLFNFWKLINSFKFMKIHPIFIKTLNRPWMVGKEVALSFCPPGF